jgi:hypothetical protein
MGRPVKKKYFVQGGVTPSDVVQYQSLGSVSVTGGGTHYSIGSTVSVNVPQDAAGVNATITVTINTSTGVISAPVITNVGSGYNVNPTVTVSKPRSVNVLSTLSTTTSVISGITTTGIYVGMRMDGSPGMPANNYVTIVGPTSVTGTYNFTSNTTTNVAFSDQGSGATFSTTLTHVESANGTFNVTAYVPVVNGGSSAVKSAIIKQKGDRTFLVENNQGRGQCKLTAGTPTAGLMTLIATDANSNTYYVTKLTSHKALLTRKTQSGSNAWVYGVLDSTTNTYIDYARWQFAGVAVLSAVGTDKTLSTTCVSLAYN